MGTMAELPPEIAQQLMAQGGGQDPQPEEMPEDHIDLTDIYEAIHAGAMLCKGSKTGAEFQQAAAGVKSLVDSVLELTAAGDTGEPPEGGASASGPGQ